jgi:hypothetical protein
MNDQHRASEPVYTIGNPQPPSPSPEATAEARWHEMQEWPGFAERLLGHFRPRLLERAPVRLYGCYGLYRLYRDAAGNRRVLHAQEHDSGGIASLFSGAEGWLCRLWPAPDGGWDDERAAETLMHYQACIGIADPAALGFELPPEG